MYVQHENNCYRFFEEVGGVVGIVGGRHAHTRFGEHRRGVAGLGVGREDHKGVTVYYVYSV